jgi:uncharacterized SAM-binding protein YcdF (DUF218 family)
MFRQTLLETVRALLDPIGWYRSLFVSVPVPQVRAVESAANRLLRAKGVDLPDPFNSPEKRRQWRNDVLVVSRYHPLGTEEYVLLIHTRIQGVTTLVYLSGDPYNAVYKPGHWERNLTFQAACL